MKNILFTLLLCFTFFTCQHEARQIPITEFSMEDLSEDDLLVDVRTPGEFEQGHLQGAVNMDWMSEDFISKWDNVDRKRKVYLYCQKGGRSAMAAGVLDSLGFRVVDLTGGYELFLQEEIP